MRIGEIAALVGLTTRATIRHYHHVGLLPEPERHPNGYRAYSVRDAVLLARVRRLTGPGLGLDEVRDVLADNAGREPAEALGPHAGLARQEAAIRERRCRLSTLLAEPSGATGPVSPALPALPAQASRTDSPSTAKDREYLTLVDATSTSSQEIFALLAKLIADPAVVELHERLDPLAVASADDPRIAPLTADLMAAVPDELFAAIPEEEVVVTGFKEALLAEYAPVQAEVVGRLMDAFVERGRG
ncbi:MerR family transcriptional regulator [Streptomyces sp. NPDC056255]|uniref:MerR family transcriptional regulator n=1 Tax=Streptomyces sp. NPDC056255 TaxID=3345764 RepID=UPI0035D7D8F0